MVPNLVRGLSPVRPAGLFGLIVLAFAVACSSAAAAERLVWFGGSAGTPRIDGIYASRFDDVAGTLSPPTRVVVLLNPCWLEVHPTLPVLYAAAAIAEGGRIESYEIDPATGGLTSRASLPVPSRCSRSIRPVNGSSPRRLSVRRCSATQLRMTA